MHQECIQRAILTEQAVSLQRLWGHATFEMPPENRNTHNKFEISQISENTRSLVPESQ
jgi:hypothetical protein